MPTESQDEVIAFLISNAGFGGLSEAPQFVETHISLVILSGPHAIKLKRAVRLGYVDFSTPERRLAACERELALNRRTAPGLYKAVHRITRQPDGSLTLNGDGALVDAVVEMVSLCRRNARYQTWRAPGDHRVSRTEGNRGIQPAHGEGGARSSSYARS